MAAKNNQRKAKQSFRLQDFGVAPVINAAGTMTSLGASRVCPEAQAASAFIADHFVSIDLLQAHASKRIAAATSAQAGMVTACTAGGITLAVSACMTGMNLARVERLPDTEGMRDLVILQAGHAINYGANVEQAIRLAGARLNLIGAATETFVHQLEDALASNKGRVAAAVYVVSHHCVQEGMLSLEQFTKICHAHKVPVIADMASEYNLKVAQKPGVDISIYSSHKFLGGPTGGIMAGKRNLIRAAYLNNRGIGRHLKIGKEGICGAVAALDAWSSRDLRAASRRQDKIVDGWIAKLGSSPGLQVAKKPDWTGNPINRLEIVVDPAKAGLYAWELADRLRKCKPPVFVREQFIERQTLWLDPCNLAEGEEQIVAKSILTVYANAKSKKNGRKMSWDQYKAAMSADAINWPG